jgi:hypothetical protein
VLRRSPLSLPYEDQLQTLTRLVDPSGRQRVDPPRDPERLVEAALYHKIAGYLVSAVERGQIRLSGELRGRLARTAAIQVAHSQALRHELAAIEPAVARACAAPPVCIKGPAVADRLYPDARLRPFADLDLLVPRHTVGRAARALRDRGYEPVHEFRPGFGERYGHDVHLARQIGRRTLDVELHWRVGDDPACTVLDHARLWPGSRLELGGGSVAVAALPQQILSLAAHLLSDRAKRLMWVQDLALAGRRAEESDWRQSFELARELGLAWVLHRGLDYAARHLGFRRPLPCPPGPPPAWGPLRAVEELDMRASLHIGRMATLGRPAILPYLRDILVPTLDGLSGTVGRDGAPVWRQLGRHVRAVALGLGSHRR